MGFLNDWNFYNSGNECPERFWRWAGLSLLAHIAGRKLCYPHGKWDIIPMLYTGLIGDAGSGKSSAKSEVKSVIVEHFSNNLQDGSLTRGPLLYSASIQSREDIAKRMGSPEAEVVWKVAGNGKLESYRSFYIIANEFENFLSVDTVKMVSFLVDIFDERWFSTGFKNAESQSFTNPHVSILSCGTPKWLMTELKMSLFEGGLGRRLILVCDEASAICPDPFQPHGWEAAKSRCIDHLKRVEQCQGRFVRSDLGKKWWHEWYVKHKKERPSDPILAQFHSTKHVMVLKVAMILALSENPDRLVLDDSNLATAEMLFNDLIPSIHKLTAGVGRNELAGIGTMVLDFVERLGGVVDMDTLRRHFRRYTATREFWDILQDYQDTGQLQCAKIENPDSALEKKIVGTPAKVAEVMEQIRRKSLGGSATPSVPPPSPSSEPGPT